MSVPTPAQLVFLRTAIGEDETYHSRFDTLLEARLMELDPEWMLAMQAEYKASQMSRWYA